MTDRAERQTEPRVYHVTFVQHNVFEADVVASSKREAAEKARLGKWEDVWNTGECDPTTIRRVARDNGHG